jgi:hypothetical protein
MSDISYRVDLNVEHCFGYGDTPEGAEQLNAAFGPLDRSGSDPATTIMALRIPFSEIGDDYNYTSIAAMVSSGEGLRHQPLRNMPIEARNALGGLFFTYAVDNYIKVGPRRMGMPMPHYFLMSHGLLVLNGRMILSGVDEKYMAEKLPSTTRVFLGRNASNHDRLIFEQQVCAFMRLLLKNQGYHRLKFYAKTQGTS